MDYLVEFVTIIPDDAPPAEIERRLTGETTRVAGLAAQGHALRVWKPLPEDGRRRALGLYRTASREELAAILDSRLQRRASELETHFDVGGGLRSRDA